MPSTELSTTRDAQTASIATELRPAIAPILSAAARSYRSHLQLSQYFAALSRDIEGARQRSSFVLLMFEH